jgi:hypothetical protein
VAFVTPGLSRARTADGWRGTGSLAKPSRLREKSLESTMDDNNHIDFNAPATLRKWPSIKNERARAADGPYLIVDGTLDDCIRQFMAKPTSQHHLYEIHTAPQGELVSAVLSAIHILEIVRLRDFL